MIYVYIMCKCFSCLRFLSKTFTNHRTALIPHYNFHPLHRHLNLIRVITAESSPLHIASIQLEPGSFGSGALAANN